MTLNLRVGQRELQGGGGQRRGVGQANGLQPADLVEDLGRGRAVVVVRAGAGALDQDPRIERAADNDRHVAGGAARQEAIQRRLLQQGVAAGQQEDVEVALVQRRIADLPLVDAQADSPDRAAVAQARIAL
jgi:hypothetical protein